MLMTTDHLSDGTDRGCVVRSYGASESVRAVLILIAATMVVRILFAIEPRPRDRRKLHGRDRTSSTAELFRSPSTCLVVAWAGGQPIRNGSPARAARSLYRAVCRDDLADVQPDQAVVRRESGPVGGSNAQSCACARLDERHMDPARRSAQRSPVSGRLLRFMALFVPGSKAPLWWLAAGACGGLAMLAKLHGIFLFAGVGLFLITSPAQRHWLATPWPYLAVAAGRCDLLAGHHLE